ncbi:MAG: hypothetical protein ABIF82_12065, partial [Planctomycetota bacterium]
EKAAPGATIKEVERKEIRAALKAGKVVKLAKPEVVYEVEVVKDGKEMEIELLIAPDGTLIGKDQDDDDDDDDD